MRYTPDAILGLKPDEVFVFGSNIQGIHGAGAAFAALKFGARRGVGVGWSGQTYAIPTRIYSKALKRFETLPLNSIAPYVKAFLGEAANHPERTFLVTRIGCGHAGYKPENIATMFVRRPDNVVLPMEFVNIINRK